MHSADMQMSNVKCMNAPLIFGVSFPQSVLSILKLGLAVSLHCNAAKQTERRSLHLKTTLPTDTHSLIYMDFIFFLCGFLVQTYPSLVHWIVTTNVKEITSMTWQISCRLGSPPVKGKNPQKSA